MKRSFVLACLLCTLAAFSYAQEWVLALSSNVELRTWKLSTKADKEEKGLGGASIKLFKGSSMISEVKSFPNGDFKIDIPANGEFMLEVSYPGCNTKKFAISTLGVPADIAKDNYRPSYGIGGFIMARPLPGIDYSYLNQAMVKVVYHSRGKFEDDNSITDRSLSAMSRISEAENALIDKFCTANRDGDAALAKPDCPLAKTLYEKALSLIPGENYPAQQLAKVGKCLQDKEAADKKAKEEADKKAKEEADKAANAKKDADKKVVEEAVAKAKADKAAQDKEMNEKLAKAAEAESKKKAEAEAAEKKKQPEAAAKAAATPAAGTPPPAQAASSSAKPKNSVIKIKDKTEEDLEEEKRRAGQRKSEAEDAEKIRTNQEKSAAKQAEKDKKYKEHLAKEEEELRQKQEEREAKQKEAAKKQAEEDAAQAEKEQKKREEAIAKEKEEAKKEAEEKAAKAEEDRRKREEAAAKEKEEAKKEAEEKAAKAEENRKKREEAEAREKEEAKKQAEEDAAKAKEAQEAQDKEDAEKAAAEKEKRKKRYEKIDEKYKNGKSNANYSIPQPLGSGGNAFKEKILKADDLFSNKKYKEARTTYEEALKLKPNDEHATNRIIEINKLLSEKPAGQ